jgi:hypothetical protein
LPFGPRHAKTCAIWYAAEVLHLATIACVACSDSVSRPSAQFQVVDGARDLVAAASASAGIPASCATIPV